ncbi:sulfur carrier protein ThiS adenylyltransferase ThiF [Helicobacter didelphidarum]|uniref:Sulfur carrier protein ThiS adenylyltransferase ThiF n=1 Tax=Helicobacter didelphidarum TaxID=2040648 RepID=A0A3D8IMP2_9HELI|nr:sulfur carrier protein ThiS adenylyltransferase ThiF [Helicobacter didelphidarum]RDU66519.1 sulfur carrier protein ThiS adenylyltransferase ThiF [Helicobacter didelphidarum]
MKIFFNGQNCHTDCINSRDFFLTHNAKECDVWIVNGFATQEAITLHEGDELFYIQRGVMPTQDALESMMRARHTPKLHEKLKQSCVGIAGLGGLGSHIAIMLARSGIGKLILIDFDVVEPSNLNRQAYSLTDLGKTKTQAMSKIIATINPFIQVKTYCHRIDETNIKQLFLECDIVCEAFDSAQTKAMLAQNFHSFFPQTILICASGLAGYGNSNAIQTRKITPNLYICGDLESEAKPGNGLIAPRVNICAAHQANLVLELLANNKS